jgi:pimeloyl-[acyl-carrier protein] synthase
MLRMLQRVVASDRAMRVVGALAGSYDLWSPAARRNPYPTWQRIRERGPLVRMRLLGAWVATHHRDVEHVLRDPAFSTDRNAVPLMRLVERATRGEPDFENLIDHNLLMIDGSKHARLRGLVSRAFTPRRVEQLRPRVEAIVAELLDEAARRRAAGTPFDLVHHFAQPLPARVIGELLGVPARDADALRHWSDDLVELLDPLSGHDGLEPPKRAARGLAELFRELLAARRRDPRDDLLSAMIAADQDGDTLDEGELLALCMLLLVAGHETTTNLIANAVILLLRHPDERKRVQDDLALVPAAVEESLRLEPPIQLTDRAVVAPCEIGGVALRPGQLVAVSLAAANRDPDVFPDPERFDVGRRETRHFAFGLGRHVCLGAALARLEAVAALEGLLRRFPDFRGDADPPDWKRSVVLRGPTALPLVLG